MLAYLSSGTQQREHAQSSPNLLHSCPTPRGTFSTVLLCILFKPYKNIEYASPVFKSSLPYCMIVFRWAVEPSSQQERLIHHLVPFMNRISLWSLNFALDLTFDRIAALFSPCRRDRGTHELFRTRLDNQPRKMGNCLEGHDPAGGPESSKVTVCQLVCANLIEIVCLCC